MKCDNCGREIKDLEAFCPRCGKQLVFGDITPYQGNDRDQELTYAGYYDEDVTTMGEEPVQDNKPEQEEPPQKGQQVDSDDPDATVMGEDPIREKDPQKAGRVMVNTPEAADFSEEPTFVEHSQKAYQRNTDDPDATVMGSDEILLKSSQEEIVLPVDSVKDKRKNPLAFIAVAVLVVLVIGIGIFAVTRNTDNTTETISDSWEEIISSVKDGTYKDKYRIGDTKKLDLGKEGVVEMQIAAFDADELADGSGKAAITWISKQLLDSEHRMNPELDVLYDPEGLEGVKKLPNGKGAIGGWQYSEMRSWLSETITPLIPEEINKSIKSVTKYSLSVDCETNQFTSCVSEEKIWIPSYTEVLGYEEDELKIESPGPYYEELFVSGDNLMKSKIGSLDSSEFWVRSASSSNSFFKVNGHSLNSLSECSSESGVCIGFCM